MVRDTKKLPICLRFTCTALRPILYTLTLYLALSGFTVPCRVSTRTAHPIYTNSLLVYLFTPLSDCPRGKGLRRAPDELAELLAATGPRPRPASASAGVSAPSRCLRWRRCWWWRWWRWWRRSVAVDAVGVAGGTAGSAGAAVGAVGLDAG